MQSTSRRQFVAAALLLACGVALPAHAQDTKGKLVLYTSQPERDAAQTIAAFKRVRPGIDVEVFRSGTTEVMGKLRSEDHTSELQSRRDIVCRHLLEKT